MPNGQCISCYLEGVGWTGTGPPEQEPSFNYQCNICLKSYTVDLKAMPGLKRPDICPECKKLSERIRLSESSIEVVRRAKAAQTIATATNCCECNVEFVGAVAKVVVVDRAYCYPCFDELKRTGRVMPGRPIAPGLFPQPEPLEPMVTTRQIQWDA